MKEKLSVKEFVNKCDFDKTYGTYVSKEDGQSYCTSCLSKGIKSPLQERGAGWLCKVKGCEQAFYPSQNTSIPDATL